jgi:hypothetical protein
MSLVISFEPILTNSGLNLPMKNFRIKSYKTTARDYRRGIAGKSYSFKHIKYGLKLLEQRREWKKSYGRIPNKSELSYRAIARKVGVSSHVTIREWDKKDMSVEAIIARLKLKALKKKFTDSEERILSGWVMYRDLTLQCSTTDNFREFGANYFGRSMSPSYITNFMSRNYCR